MYFRSFQKQLCENKIMKILLMTILWNISAVNKRVGIVDNING